MLGGSDAAIGRWPWMLALLDVAAGTLTFRCGATLISDQFALTAANCTEVGYVT